MDDEKPLDLRDKLAIEIFNGVVSNTHSSTEVLMSDIIYHINSDSGSDVDEARDIATKAAAKRVERIVRACYKVADIMRKVRLATFE